MEEVEGWELDDDCEPPPSLSWTRGLNVFRTVIQPYLGGGPFEADCLEEASSCGSVGSEAGVEEEMALLTSFEGSGSPNGTLV